MSTSAYSDDLAFAHRLADIADAITLDRYQAQDLVVSTKPDKTPVTDADRATEQAIMAAIAKERAQDGIVGEEFGKSKENAERYWVIDPIDGTKNFMRGVPTWATLIGLVERSSDGTESVVVGVVSAPALARRWYSSTGSGAYVVFANGAPKKISVSKVDSIANSSVAYSDFVGWNEKLSSFRKLLDSALRTRGYGDFWSHMLVAEGALDFALEPQLALWDMAALEVIVNEAGGRFSNFTGVDGSSGPGAISSNHLLHDLVLTELK
jgi:histidinol-phosphatase